MTARAESRPLAAGIAIRGARVHNLRSISLELPHQALIVCTGVSGSGKSSLAFDTVFAEGQRRGLGTLGPAVRLRVAHWPRPDCDSLSGLPPVIAVGQRNAGTSPRGTLATLAEVAPFLRLLFARGGVAHCPQCRQPVVSQTLEEIVESVCAGEVGRRALLLANVARLRRGTHRDTLAQLARQGLVRARVNGEVIDLSLVTELPKGRSHTIDAVVDRIVFREGLQQRVRDSIALALKLGEGACSVSTETPDGWVDRTYSAKHTCVPCGLALPGLAPQSLNSNTPEGACPKCAGLGWLKSPSSAGLVSRGTAPGASKKAGSRRADRLPTKPPTGDSTAPVQSAPDQRLCDECGGERLGPVGRQVVYRGTTLPRWFAQTVEAAAESWEQWCQSPDPLLERVGSQVATRLKFLQQAGLGYLGLDRPTETLSGGELQRARLSGALGAGLVGVCYVLDEPTTGLHARDTAQLLDALRALRDQGNTVIVVEHDIEVIRAADWLVDLGPGAGTEGGLVVAAGPVVEVARHPTSHTARFLRGTATTFSTLDVGRVRNVTNPRPDGDVSPAAPSPDQSCGPSPALAPGSSPRSPSDSRSHPQDSPGANQRPTGAPESSIAGPGGGQPCVELSGVRLRNLKEVRVEIPLQRLVCVTGVSGSGKSSLVIEALVPLVQAALSARSLPLGKLDSPSSPAPVMGSPVKGSPVMGSPTEETLAGSTLAPELGTVRGAERLSRLVVVDQSPPPRAARASPATLSGVWTEIRGLLARTRDARRLGFGPARFSRLSPVGRCVTCRGLGTRPVPLDWLPEAQLECPVCRGTGFNPQTLEVRLLGRNVAQLLTLSLQDAATLFDGFARIAPVLRTFVDLGLGYLTLGQSASSLSGGEAQRVKLACELSRGRSLAEAGGTLYVLDEPTTGLHPADIERLLQVLRGLVDQGHTVLTIEHQLDLVASADWLIDLGPEGGAGGGRVIAAGTPPQVAHAGTGPTALALRQHTGW